MANTYTRSATSTFTLTDAVYLASKVAADLRQLQAIHGEPSIGDIEKYVLELAMLLADGYVESVSYGFEKDGRWIAALDYPVRFGGGRSDERPGRVPLSDTSGAVFTSFLAYSQRWWDLPHAERQRIESDLPIKRVSGMEPGGSWSAGDRTYSRHDVALCRRSIG